MTHCARALAVIAVLLGWRTASGMGFLFTPSTLTEDAAQAKTIFVATPCCSRFDPRANFQGGISVVRLDTIIKSDPMIVGCRCVTINRYIPMEKTGFPKYLFFCDIVDGRLDAVMGIPLKPDSKIADYLAGALALPQKDASTRLAYFWKFLDNPEEVIADDAYLEFDRADYKDLRPVAKKLDPDVLARRLKDPKTPFRCLGLYASLLGDCGRATDGQLLRTMLDQSTLPYATYFERLLTGYLRLQPKEAWTYLRGIFGDAKKDFLVRYYALRAARFIIEFRPDLVSKADIVSGVSIMLMQDDIADLVIDDLRKWQCWDMTDKVLSLADVKTLNMPIIRKTIFCFALRTAAINPKSAAFVAAERKRDPELTKQAEEWLEVETLGQKASPPTKPEK